MIDESHATMPQLRGMYHGDRSRKTTLVEFGFRLPSALDNRPLMYEEFEARRGQTIYVSATPAPYELTLTGGRGRRAGRAARPGSSIPRSSSGRSTDRWTICSPRSARGSRAGERVLVTTLTKRMAEDLTEYYREVGVKVEYLHSDVETLERVKILRELRKGTFDVLVGVNLLREGLDLPEVSLVAILDADKEGFLRSEGSLIQTIGPRRAQRERQGDPLRRQADRFDARGDGRDRAAPHASRRRTTRSTASRPRRSAARFDDLLTSPVGADYSTVPLDEEPSEEIFEDQEALIAEIARLDKAMRVAAHRLDFEAAAAHRDRIRYLETKGVLA